LIEEQLRHVIRQEGWSLLDIRINHWEPFKEVYGFVAGDDVLRFTGVLLGEVVDQVGSVNDFIGHAGGDNFVITCEEESGERICEILKSRFSEESLSHYNFLDRQQGYILTYDSRGEPRQTPLMSLSVGIVSPSRYNFADIREITEMAAEARRASV
jgi:GGDEF domain-containing protein